MPPHIQPNALPALPEATVREVIDRLLRETPACDGPGIMAACPVKILGVRGYFRNTLGRLGINDFGVFDDAGFVVTPDEVLRFNWNCDPSRKGWNPGVGKFYAQLMPGVWPLRQGPHKAVAGALRQLTSAEARRASLDDYFWDARAKGKFTVRRVRDDNVGALETSYQAINVHSGARTGTSSWGCQTLPPDQWPVFSARVYAAMDQHGQRWDTRQRLFGWVPYVLTEERLAGPGGAGRALI
jgi:hypothetical protein